MIRVEVAKLTPGLKLAQPVVHNGSILAENGICLTDDCIRHFIQKNIPSVFIRKDSLSKMNPSEDRIDFLYLQIKNFKPGVEHFEKLLGYVDELGSIIDIRAVSALEDILRLTDRRLDLTRLKIRVIEKLMLQEPSLILGNIFLIQLRLSDIPAVQEKCFEGLYKIRVEECLLPFLFGIRHYPEKYRSLISKVFSAYNLKFLVETISLAMQKATGRESESILSCAEGILPVQIIEKLRGMIKKS